MQKMILIVDFGSQYTQLIARRVRELNVYCEVYPWDKCPEIGENIKGLILSGSSFAMSGEHAPKMDLNQFRGKLPMLGIGYGAELLVNQAGGEVSSVGKRDYGKSNINVLDQESDLLRGISSPSQVWMTYGDSIESLPKGFKAIAESKESKNCAFEVEGEKTFGIQFHPEVYHSVEGKEIIQNFIVNIANCAQDWSPEAFVKYTVASLKEELGNEKVVLGLSGGVDSSVAAVLLHKAIGSNLHCVFVNHGLLRKNEYDEVLESYKGMGLNVKGVNAAERFYAALKGETDPEKKRKIIGKIFVDVFDDESKRIENVGWLGQGTIYPDIIESVGADGTSGKAIKSHHNVGGLPDYMKLKIIEPLKLLFKDEVRKVGAVLNIDKNIVGRHPFPGPGLGIRILGEVTAERVNILQQADAVFINVLKENGLYDKIWQAGAILLPVNTVGVTGDQRTYENAVALRAVTSVDGMTADWYPMPYDILGEVSNKIINQVEGINRVTYDVSSKPPATIEWE